MPSGTVPNDKAWQDPGKKANEEYRRRRITIDPVTRLEGHGKIEVFLDDAGEVERAYFQVPELRGFEKFVQGRPVEEMPQIPATIDEVIEEDSEAKKRFDRLGGLPCGSERAAG